MTSIMEGGDKHEFPPQLRSCWNLTTSEKESVFSDSVATGRLTTFQGNTNGLGEFKTTTTKDEKAKLVG